METSWFQKALLSPLLVQLNFWIAFGFYLGLVSPQRSPAASWATLSINVLTFIFRNMNINEPRNFVSSLLANVAWTKPKLFGSP